MTSAWATGRCTGRPGCARTGAGKRSCSSRTTSTRAGRGRQRRCNQPAGAQHQRRSGGPRAAAEPPGRSHAKGVAGTSQGCFRCRARAAAAGPAPRVLPLAPIAGRFLHRKAGVGELPSHPADGGKRRKLVPGRLRVATAASTAGCHMASLQAGAKPSRYQASTMGLPWAARSDRCRQHPPTTGPRPGAPAPAAGGAGREQAPGSAAAVRPPVGRGRARRTAPWPGPVAPARYFSIER